MPRRKAMPGSALSDAGLDGIPLRPIEVRPIEVEPPLVERAAEVAPEQAGPAAAPDPQAMAASTARELAARAREMTPAQRAEFLFALDGLLAALQNQAAIEACRAEGDSIHPRHRLTHVCEFFAARVKECERVLDLGCGCGGIAAAVAGRCHAHVLGIERQEALVSAGRAAALRRGMSKLRFLAADAATHRVEESFDVLIVSGLLEYLDDRPAVLRRWVEWYRPSRVLVRVHAFDRTWRTAYKKELGVEWRADPAHKVEYTRSTLERELGAGGLRMTECLPCWGEYWAVAVPVGA